jgi:RHS repeat-associated protein
VTHRLASHWAVGSNPSAGPLLDLSYSEYDAMGHLLRLRDVAQQIDHWFRYDAAYRLRTASAFDLGNGTGTPYDFLYLYDSLSNLREERDAATSGGKIFGYRADGSQPHAATSVTPRINGSPSLFPTTLNYAYGNLTSEERCQGSLLDRRCVFDRTFEYTVEDRLIRSVQAGRVTTYGWDGMGERAWQKLERPDGSSTTVYSLGRFLDVLVDQDAGGQVTTTVERHLYAGAQRIATRRQVVGSPAVSERHYLWDHLGSVRAVANEFGDLLARRDYLPFGKAAPMAAGGGRFGFTGEEEGLDDGLYLLGPRAYDPSLLRFLSPDPMIPDPAMSIGYNRYAYAFNNPVNLVDPSGHSPLFAIVGLFLASISLAQDLGGALATGDTDAALIAVGSFAVKAFATAVGQAAGAALYDDIVSTVGGGALNETVATGVDFAVSSAFSTLGQEIASGKPELGSLLKNVGLSAATGFVVGAFVGGVRADILGVDVTHNKEVQAQLSKLETFYRNEGHQVDFSGVTVRQGGLAISSLDPAPVGFALWGTVTLRGNVPLRASSYQFYSTMAHELAHVAQMSDDFLMPVHYLLYYDTFPSSVSIPFEAQAYQWEAAYVYCKAWGGCQ